MFEDTRTIHLNDKQLLDLIKTQVREVCPDCRNNIHVMCPHEVVVMGAHVVGANPKRLAEITGYSLQFVNEIDKRMRNAGIWDGDKVDTAEWQDLIVFELHVLVAMGNIILKRGSGPHRYIVEFVQAALDT